MVTLVDTMVHQHIMHNNYCATEQYRTDHRFCTYSFVFFIVVYT